MPYRIRAVKKESKGPNLILQEGAILADAYARHRKVAWGFLGLLALGVLAGLVVWQISSQKEARAWAIEDEATRLYHENPELAAILERKEFKDKNEHYKKALALFQKVVQEYPRTSAASLSQYYVGNTEFELKEYDQAIQAYQKFLDRYGEKAPLAPLVETKLAYVLQQTGKPVEALKAFQRITENAKALNQDEAYYEMGRLYEAQDNKADAIATYEKTVQNFKGSPWSSEAQARLAVLRPAPPNPAQGAGSGSFPGSKGSVLNPPGGNPPSASPSPGALPSPGEKAPSGSSGQEQGPQKKPTS